LASSSDEGEEGNASNELKARSDKFSAQFEGLEMPESERPLLSSPTARLGAVAPYDRRLKKRNKSRFSAKLPCRYGSIHSPYDAAGSRAVSLERVVDRGCR
jgi:hypothetical protein